MSKKFVIPLKNCRNIKIGTTNDNAYQNIIGKRTVFSKNENETTFNWYDEGEYEYWVNLNYLGEEEISKNPIGSRNNETIVYLTDYIDVYPQGTVLGIKSRLYYDTRQITISSENFILRKNDFSMDLKIANGSQIVYGENARKLNFEDSSGSENVYFVNDNSQNRLILNANNILDSKTLIPNADFYIFTSSISSIENSQFLLKENQNPKFEYVYNDDGPITITYRFIFCIVLIYTNTDGTKKYFVFPVAYKLKNIETYYSIENQEFSYPNENINNSENEYVLELNNEMVQDYELNKSNLEMIYNSYESGKTTIEVEITLGNYYDYEGKIYISKNTLINNNNINSIAQVGDIFKISNVEKTRYGVYIKDKEFLISEVKFEYNGVPKMTLLGKEI